MGSIYNKEFHTLIKINSSEQKIKLLRWVMYTISHPRMEKKQYVSKKSSHFHFDPNDSGATDT